MGDYESGGSRRQSTGLASREQGWFRCWTPDDAFSVPGEPPYAQPQVRWCERATRVTPSLLDDARSIAHGAAQVSPQAPCRTPWHRVRSRVMRRDRRHPGATPVKSPSGVASGPRRPASSSLPTNSEAKPSRCATKRTSRTGKPMGRPSLPSQASLCGYGP